MPYQNLNIMYDFGPIDVEVIENFEQDKKINFPLSYKNLMTCHNGVQFIENSFEYFDSNNEVGESSIAFCCFGQGVGGDHIENCQDQDIYGHDRIVIFGLNGCGDYIGFDYGSDVNHPKVVLMYHDQYIKDQYGQPKLKLLEVCDSFDNFLSLLGLVEN